MAQSNPAAVAIGVATINNSIGGTVKLVNGGSSESSSLNSQTAQAQINTTTSTALNSANASFTGTTNTTGVAQAWNYSTGGGTGTALSSGSAAAGVAGVANVANIGVTGVPLAAANGITGDLAGAGGLSAGAQESVVAGTNQGGVAATATSGTLQVSLGASTDGAVTTGLNDNGSTNNQVTLTDTNIGNVTVSGATGNVNLTTGTDQYGNPITTTLSPAQTSVSGGGSYSATTSGGAAVVAAGGTVNGIEQAVTPGVTQIIDSNTAGALNNL
jgi:hypothetical protein